MSAAALFAPGKGILALDTPPERLGARLRAVGVLPGEPTAAAFRAMLLATPDLGARTSGVVLPMAAAGDVAAEVPAEVPAGVLVGVRADTGPDGPVTGGLDGLAARLAEAGRRGAAFAVWSVHGATTMRALTLNSQAAARFAATCQEVGLLPVVRVGSRPDRATGTLTAALLSVLGQLDELDVELPGTVLSTLLDPDALGVVPAGIGGVALSTTTAPALAAPWPVTFYLGREATCPAMRAWRGRAPVAAQRALLETLRGATIRRLRRVPAPPRRVGRSSRLVQRAAHSS